MKKSYKTIVAIVGMSVIFGCAENHNESLEQDDSNMRTEYLDHDGALLTPDGEIILPNQSFAVPEKGMLAEMASVREQLDSVGYVDMSEHLSTADSTLSFMRSAYNGTSNVEKDSPLVPLLSLVQKTIDYDFSKISAGKVDPTIMTPTTEAYILASRNSITRVYSNTKYGNIYIDEQIGARMGVLPGYSDEPNFHIANQNGYRTTILYANEKMVTFILMKTKLGITLIEIGSAFENADTELENFMSILLSSHE
jgi:hypothetical protein